MPGACWFFRYEPRALPVPGVTGDAGLSRRALVRSPLRIASSELRDSRRVYHETIDERRTTGPVQSHTPEAHDGQTRRASEQLNCKSAVVVDEHSIRREHRARIVHGQQQFHFVKVQQDIGRDHGVIGGMQMFRRDIRELRRITLAGGNMRDPCDCDLHNRF